MIQSCMAQSHVRETINHAVSEVKNLTNVLGNAALGTMCIAFMPTQFIMEAAQREVHMVERFGFRSLGFATFAYLRDTLSGAPDEPIRTAKQIKEDKAALREWAEIVNSPNFHYLPGDDMIG